VRPLGRFVIASEAKQSRLPRRYASRNDVIPRCLRRGCSFTQPYEVGDISCGAGCLRHGLGVYVGQLHNLDNYPRTM